MTARGRNWFLRFRDTPSFPLPLLTRFVPFYERPGSLLFGRRKKRPTVAHFIRSRVDDFAAAHEIHRHVSSLISAPKRGFFSLPQNENAPRDRGPNNEGSCGWKFDAFLHIQPWSLFLYIIYPTYGNLTIHVYKLCVESRIRKKYTRTLLNDFSIKMPFPLFLFPSETSSQIPPYIFDRIFKERLPGHWLLIKIVFFKRCEYEGSETQIFGSFLRVIRK